MSFCKGMICQSMGSLYIFLTTATLVNSAFKKPSNLGWIETKCHFIVSPNSKSIRRCHAVDAGV